MAEGAGDNFEGQEAAEQNGAGENTDLAAAARFLGKRAGDEQLLERIESALSANDGILLTSELVSGFVAALAVPLEDDKSEQVITVNLEGCLQVVLALLKELCNMDQQLVLQVAEGLSGGNDLGDMRMRSLALLYNSVDQGVVNLRYRLLMMLIELGGRLNRVEQLDAIFCSLDSLVKGFQLDEESSRALYSLVADSLRSAGDVERAQRFTMKKLETYNGASDTELDSMRDSATQVVIDAISLPKQFRFDALLDLDAVKRLKYHDEGTLYDLLVIFVKSELAEYLEFYGQHQSFVEKTGLDHQQCMDKMRLLTFASLGNRSRELRYQEIADALNISMDEVESWVIRAISSGLVETKMNQITQTVTINRSTVRYFTEDQWGPLSDRLSLWTENVQTLLRIVHEARKEVV